MASLAVSHLQLAAVVLHEPPVREAHGHPDGGVGDMRSGGAIGSHVAGARGHVSGAGERQARRDEHGRGRNCAGYCYHEPLDSVLGMQP